MHAIIWQKFCQNGVHSIHPATYYYPYYFHSLVLQHMSEILALFNEPHETQKAVSSEETFTPTVISLIVICCLLIVGTIILIIYIQQTTKKYVIKIYLLHSFLFSAICLSKALKNERKIFSRYKCFGSEIVIYMHDFKCLLIYFACSKCMIFFQKDIYLFLKDEFSNICCWFWNSTPKSEC